MPENWKPGGLKDAASNLWSSKRTFKRRPVWVLSWAGSIAARILNLVARLREHWAMEIFALGLKANGKSNDAIGLLAAGLWSDGPPAPT